MTNENAINILRHLSPPRTSKAAFDAFKQAIEMAIEALEQPEIIYCGDCKYKDDGIDEDGVPFLKCLHGRSYGGTRINDFCSWAEKREEKK